MKKKLFLLNAPVLSVLLFLVSCNVPPLDKVVLPEPTGIYNVGRCSVYLMDESRDEVFSNIAGQKREIMLWIHYPIQVTSEAPSPYLTSALVDDLPTEILKSQGIDISQIQDPDVFRQFINNIHSHSIDEAALLPATGGYPVLIFSHGAVNHPLSYSSMLEEMASHGYIVISVAHTYNAPLTAFPDGRLVTSQFAEGSELMQGVLQQDPQALAKYVAHYRVTQPADLAFVIDKLSWLNQNHQILTGGIDLQRVAVFGHSMGGETVIQTAIEKSGVKATLLLDSNLGFRRPTSVNHPVMFIRSQQAEPDTPNSPELEQAYAEAITYVKQSPKWWSMMLKQSVHGSFITDFMFINPELQKVFSIPYVFMGEDPNRAFRVLTDYMTAFFNAHLKDSPEILLQEASPDHPEMVFERYIGS